MVPRRPQWFWTSWNRNVSTRPLAHPLARSLAPLTRSLAPHCSLRSRAPLRSPTPELVGQWNIFVQFSKCVESLCGGGSRHARVTSDRPRSTADHSFVKGRMDLAQKERRKKGEKIGWKWFPEIIPLFSLKKPIRIQACFLIEWFWEKETSESGELQNWRVLAPKSGACRTLG